MQLQQFFVVLFWQQAEYSRPGAVLNVYLSMTLYMSSSLPLILFSTFIELLLLA